LGGKFERGVGFPTDFPKEEYFLFKALLGTFKGGEKKRFGGLGKFFFSPRAESDFF